MRLFILLILIAFNVQAKKQKHVDVYTPPPSFRAILIKPFNVDLHYPIPHLNYDPDRNKILIKGKRYRDRAIGIVDEEVILVSEIDKHAFALNSILDQNTRPQDVFSDVINIKTQKAMATINKIRSHNYEAYLMSYTFMEQTGIPEFLKILAKFHLCIDDFNNFLMDTIAVDKFHDKLIVPKLPLTHDNIYDFSKFSNNQDFFTTDIYTALIISISKKKFNLLNVKNLYKSLVENDLIDLREKFNEGKYGIKVRLTLVYIDPNKRKYRNMGVNDNINKKIIGPIPGKRKMIYIKILKKERKYTMGELDLKIRHCFIKKNIKKNTQTSIYEKNAEIKILERLRHQLKKNKKPTDSICKDEWLKDLELNKTARSHLAVLEKNEVSKVFEDSNGWHVAKILEKHLNKRSDAYENIYPIYRNEQLFLLLDNYLKLIRRQAYKIIYTHE